MRLNNILRWIVVGALSVAAIVPLYVSNSLFFPFISGKNFAFRILIEVAFAAWVFLALRHSEYRPRRSPLFYAVLSFLVVLGVATFLAEDPYKSFWSNFERMDGFIGLIHFALYFFVAGTLLRTADWRRLVGISLGVNTLVIGYSLLQFFGVLAINQGGMRVDATFGNAIYLGVYALFHLFFSINAIQWARRAGKHTALTSLLVALVFGNLALIVLSETRGVMLGLLVGVMVASIYAACSRGVSRTMRRVGFIGCAVTLVVIGTYFAIRNVPQLRTNPVFGRILSTSIASDDAQARFIIWGISWKGFTERPLFGWGQEGFNFVFNKYYDPRLYNREAWFDRAHNAYLDWLIAGGIFGLLGYLALWWYAARIILCGKRENGERLFTPASRALMLGFGTAYAVNNIFVFDNGVSHVLFFLLLAYIHSRATEETPPLWKSAVTPSGAFARFYAPCIMVVLIFALYWFNARPAYAGALLLDALHAQSGGPAENLAIFKRALALNTFADAEIREQLAQVTVVVAPISTIPLTTKQEFLNSAASELDKEIKERSADARYYTFMGTLLDTFGLREQSFPYWRRAGELSPSKQLILLQAGGNRFTVGKQNEALQYFKRAYELNPENREAVIVYAAGLIYSNNREEEKKVLLTPSYKDGPALADPRLLRAYESVGRVEDAIALWQIELTHHPEARAVILKNIQDLRYKR